MLRQATAPDWVSCGANDVCGAREQVIAAIARRHNAAIQVFNWELVPTIKPLQCLVANASAKFDAA